MTSQARLAAQTKKSGFNNCELGANLTANQQKTRRQYQAVEINVCMQAISEIAIYT